jgi:hypothetical protein
MWHQIMRTAMLYPGYVPRTTPQLLHYGLRHTVNTTEGLFQWDKHWHFDFDPMQCPPWKHVKGRDGGVFPRAPSPRVLLPARVRTRTGLLAPTCWAAGACQRVAARLLVEHAMLAEGTRTGKRSSCKLLSMFPDG